MAVESFAPQTSPSWRQEGGWYLWDIQYFKKKKLIYLFLAALGPCCCVQAFSSYGKQGLLFVAVCGLLILVASLVAEHGL